MPHLDLQVLLAGGVEAMDFEEVDDLLAQRGRCLAPSACVLFLQAGGKQVDQVDSEDGKGLKDAVNLVFADGQYTAWRECLIGMGEALGQSEDALCLKHLWAVPCLGHRKGVVRRGGVDMDLAVGEKEQPVACISVGSDNLARSVLVEPESGMGHYKLQIALAHALEEGKLQQLVV